MLLALTLALLLVQQPDARQGASGSATATALPPEIPLFPLPEVSLFPGVRRPFLIFEPRYREMVADALKGDRIIGMVVKNGIVYFPSEVYPKFGITPFADAPKVSKASGASTTP